MLADQVIPLALSKGLETKVDPKQLGLGQLVTLENGVFTSPMEIRKRNGYSAFSRNTLSGSVITSANALATFNDQLIAMTDNYLYAYSDSVSKWNGGAISGGSSNTRLQAASLENVVIGSGGSEATVPKIVTISSTLALATWYNFDTSSAYYAYVDLTDNSIISSGTFSTQPVVDINMVLAGTTVWVFNTHTTGGSPPYEVSATGFSTDPSVGITTASTTPLQPTLFSTYPNNCVITDSSNNIYATYQNSTTISIYKYDSSLNHLANTDVTGDADTPVSIVYNSSDNMIWIAYSHSGVLKVSSITTALTTITPVTGSGVSLDNLTALSIIVGDSQHMLIYSCIGVSEAATVSTIITTPVVQYQIVDTTSNIFFGNNYLYTNVNLYSNPYMVPNGDVYLTLGRYSAVQSTYFLIKHSAAVTNYTTPQINITTKFSNLTGNISQASDGFYASLARIQYPSTDLFVIPGITITSEKLIDTSYIYQSNINMFKVTIGTDIQSLSLGNNLNIIAGINYVFDGLGVAEAGFNLFPDNLAYEVGTSGSIAAGTYSYLVLYEWIDTQGNLHRSAPSVFSATTAGMEVVVGSGSSRVYVMVPQLTLTTEYKYASSIRISLWRTTNGGTTYYLIDTIAQKFSASITTVKFIDSFSDSQITGNTQLYTTGGEVENISPPAFLAATSFKNRVFGIDSENPLNIWYSKQVIQGFPVEYSDLFTQAIDQRSGPCTAIFTLDDKLIIFKENLIFYIFGDGPSPAGTDNNFTYPQVISTDVGCSNPKSLVLTPNGIMFQAAKGIYLLDRSLQTHYIGSPVERYNSSTVTSARLINNTTQVRFTLDSGVVLVYDDFVNQWSVFTNISALDSATYKGNFTYIKSDGTVLTETPGTYSDNGSIISLKLTVGWSNFAGVQGFQRVREFLILGESESATTLTTQIAYDFDSTIVQTETIPVSAAGIPMQYRIFPTYQKCESIQITLYDTPATATEGLRISGMAFKVAAKKGAWKMPASKSY